MLTRLFLEFQLICVLVSVFMLFVVGHVVSAAMIGGMSVGFYVAAWVVWFVYE